VIGGLRRFFGEAGEARRFRALPRSKRNLVVYAEGTSAWPHIGPVVEELLGRGHRIAYWTETTRDPLHGAPPDGMEAFAVGSGLVLAVLAASLEARLFFTTTPDLDTLHVRRSGAAPVHYASAFHSLVSTHMIYRPDAFDAFDTVLCAGPHQVEEIRAREAREGLPAKTLVEFGYPRLDALLEEARAAGPPTTDPPRILLAPSWGPEGILERGAASLVEALVGADFEVIVRPHPETRKRTPEALDELHRRFDSEPAVRFEEDVRDRSSLRDAAVLVSDYSGAAYEYAFAFERPVLFLDVPRKVRNPGYPELGIEPMEVRLRDQVGRVLAPEDVARAPEVIRELLAAGEPLRESIRAARAAHVFHPGEARAVGADALEERMSRKKARA